MGEMLHYQMEYGGKTLQEKLGDIEAASKNFPFYTFMRDILEIGGYLLINGLIHNDLHSANIMMNKKFHPRLIDFGRSYYSRDITQDTLNGLAAEYAPGPGYSQITPECTVQDGLASGIPFSTIIQDLIDRKDGLIYAERLFGQSRQKEVAEFKNFWATSKAVQQEDYLSFWSLYWPAVDAWAIGGVLASVINKLNNSSGLMQTKQWKAKAGLIQKIITGLLKASPRQRLDCMEALALYDPKNSVVLSASGKAWLEKKKAQREKLSA